MADPAESVKAASQVDLLSPQTNFTQKSVEKARSDAPRITCVVVLPVTEEEIRSAAKAISSIPAECECVIV